MCVVELVKEAPLKADFCIYIVIDWFQSISYEMLMSNVGNQM